MLWPNQLVYHSPSVELFPDEYFLNLEICTHEFLVKQFQVTSIIFYSYNCKIKYIDSINIENPNKIQLKIIHNQELIPHEISNDFHDTK